MGCVGAAPLNDRNDFSDMRSIESKDFFFDKLFVIIWHWYLLRFIEAKKDTIDYIDYD